MRVEQFVMAYRADHEAINKLLPEGYESLRPVLRINAEILKDDSASAEAREYNYIEFNTPVEHKGKRGWMNLGNWDSMSTDIRIAREGTKTSFIFGLPGLQGNSGLVAGAFGASSTMVRGSAKALDEEVLQNGVVLKLTHIPVGKEGGCPAEKDNQGCYYAAGTEEEEFLPAEIIDGNKEYTDCSFAWGLPEVFAKSKEEAPALFKAMSIECIEVLGAYTVTFERKNEDLRIYR